MLDHVEHQVSGRLLVIDDDPGTAAVISRIARSSGYDVIATADPVDFRHKVRTWRPATIVLDLAMPEMDGVELLRFLADEDVQAKVVIVSGFDTRTVEAAERIGARRGLNMAGTLTKPFRAAALVRLLRSADSGTITAPRLIEALQADELFLEFQPRIDLRSFEADGVEALLRWRHPQEGVVSPLAFVPIAEQSDLIHRLTEWVLERALTQRRDWTEAGLDLRVSVNLSARNLEDRDLNDLVVGVCSRCGADPSALTLEVTESVAMGNVDRSMHTLSRLRLKGIGLAIDDFGTGYSSLVQLQRLPFSELKIDKSFVVDCATSRDNAVIVSATIGLAHRLGLSVVAEGVENQAALDFLRSEGCDWAQGYFLSKPLAGDAVPGWIRGHAAAAGG